MERLGLDVSWEVITGKPDFYQCTKGFHNALQGQQVSISDRLLKVYEDTNAQTAEELRSKLQDADVVFVHDPQPAPLLHFIEKRTGKWIWRCHIDPVGVIEAYRIAKKAIPLQLVLAGGGASDDPEGAAVLEEVERAADGDRDIHILELPADAHRTINALQRCSDIVIQKSTKEGFGLTVTEALWKRKPVVGGDTGGIRLQVINHYTGFLVRTPEGAALRIRYLLHDRRRLNEMGVRAHRFVRENFLLTRHLKEYLAVMLSAIIGKDDDRIEVWKWK